MMVARSLCHTPNSSIISCHLIISRVPIISIPNGFFWHLSMLCYPKSELTITKGFGQYRVDEIVMLLLLLLHRPGVSSMAFEPIRRCNKRHSESCIFKQKGKELKPLSFSFGISHILSFSLSIFLSFFFFLFFITLCYISDDDQGIRYSG